MNIVLVILDTLRQDHVGAYGNDRIETPNLDALAAESVRYTRAYPESLPTLCARRTIYTGKRTFPFHGHREWKGDFARIAPGWGPIPEEQDTVSELLGAAGYRCGLISDCYHQFKPSRNFHRGFDEWVWIRGQEGDKYRSGPAPTQERLERHLPTLLADNPAVRKFLTSYLRNTPESRPEEDYFPAQVFREASRWIRDNADAERFFLVVECFDPHEPWDPPTADRERYDADDDGVVDVLQSMYGTWQGKLTPRELRRLQANYAGEVTLADRWFGRFYDQLRESGRLDDSLVVVMSDHGHNLGYPGDKGLVSKQGHPLTRAVADLALMIRHPDGTGAGTTHDALLYHHDVTETMLALAAADVADSGRDGIVVWPGSSTGRDHVTIGWGPLVTVVTDEWWFNGNVWGEGRTLHTLDDDPLLQRNLADERPEVCEALLALAVEDAGGEIPEHMARFHGTPGCTPFEDISVHWEEGLQAPRVGR